MANKRTILSLVFLILLSIASLGPFYAKAQDGVSSTGFLEEVKESAIKHLIITIDGYVGKFLSSMKDMFVGALEWTGNFIITVLEFTVNLIRKGLEYIKEV